MQKRILYSSGTESNSDSIETLKAACKAAGSRTVAAAHCVQLSVLAAGNAAADAALPDMLPA